MERNLQTITNLAVLGSIGFLIASVILNLKIGSLDITLISLPYMFGGTLLMVASVLSLTDKKDWVLRLLVMGLIVYGGTSITLAIALITNGVA